MPGFVMNIDEQAAWDFIRHGYVLSPRSVLKVRRTNFPKIFPLKHIDNAEIPDLFARKLKNAMGPLAKTRRAVMFSGGFDSLLVCLLARECGANVKAVTVAFENFNPLTVRGSVEAAASVGIEHHILHVKTAEFLSSMEALAGLTDEPVFDLDLAIVHAALKKYDRRIAGNVFISGMGSDQWFGNESLQAKAEGFQAQLQGTISAEAAHQKVARADGCSFIFPFIARPMLALAQAIPVRMKKNKQLLRALSVAQEIPSLRTPREMQVPAVVRRLLIQVYGRRAWPDPVTESVSTRGLDQRLRQIVLGLWLEKIKRT
jgi:asparagine synthetase B (glutamine-hydrolysing)